MSIDQPGGPLPQASDHKIRLLEYHAPESTTTTECGGPKATAALTDLIPVETTVHLEADRDDTDRYGRFLRYVYTEDGDMVNLQMVRRGHGEAVLYQPNDAHIDAMRQAETVAREANRGIWGSPCELDAAEHGPGPQPRPQHHAPGRSPDDHCDSSYPGVCIAAPPPHFDCSDVAHGDFRVEGSDPHRFDGNNDGRGCER